MLDGEVKTLAALLGVADFDYAETPGRYGPGKAISGYKLPCFQGHTDCHILFNGEGAWHCDDTGTGMRETLSVFRDKALRHRYRWRTMGELAEMVAGESQYTWVWNGMLREGAATLLAAAPKAGKTTLLAHLLNDLGQKFLGLGSTPAQVLYISEEAPVSLVEQAELPYLSRLRMTPYVNWVVTTDEHTESLVGENLAEYVRGAVQILRKQSDWPVLVVIDTIRHFLGIENENDAADVRNKLRPFIVLTRQERFALCLVHHARKRTRKVEDLVESVSGSAAFAGMVDVVIGLTRPGESHLDPRRQIVADGRYRDIPRETRTIILGDEGYEVEDEVINKPGRKPDLKVYRAILDTFNKTHETGQRRLAKLVGCSDTQIRNAFRYMIEHGWVMVEDAPEWARKTEEEDD